MNPKSKSLLLLVGTLVLGIVLGAIGNGALNNKRMKENREIRSRPGGFSNFITRIVDPVDESQRLQIEEVLADYGEKFRTLGHGHQVEMRAIGDSMLQDLRLVLSEDQVSAVEEALSRRRERGLDARPSRRQKRTLPQDDTDSR